MATTGFGTGGWGVGEWGVTSASTSMYVVSASATSTRTVLVQLSEPPTATSASAAGDALNPASWSVTRVSDASVYTIVSVRQVSSLSFELALLEKLPGYPITMNASAAGVLDGSGLPIGTPDNADFYGIAVAAATYEESVTRDLRNNPFDSQDTIAGTLSAADTGDYTNHSGIPFVRKLVMRRLLTVRGGFFHLPSYGAGMRSKGPVTQADLPRLRADAELQLLQEPEFSAVRVKMSLDNATGTLTISVVAKLSGSSSVISEQFNIPLLAL